jgi:hypothetical protein
MPQSFTSGSKVVWTSIVEEHTGPDTATLMQCCSEVVSFLKGSEIRIHNEFLQNEQTIRTPYAQSYDPAGGRIISGNSCEYGNPSPAWSSFTYHGKHFTAKETTVELNAISKNHRMHYVSPGMIQQSRRRVLIGSTNEGEVRLFRPNMSIFMTPHTFSNGTQCTGKVPKPSGPFDIHRFIDGIEASIGIANMDSAATNYFDDIKIDDSFLVNYCTSRPSENSRIL